MKKHYFVLLALAAVLFSGCTPTSMSLSVQGGSNRTTVIDRRIQNRDFTIDVRSASPMGWRTVHLAPGYRLRVWGNMVHSRLPYFGRPFRVPPGRNRGLFFHATTHDYQVMPGLRGEALITFSVWSGNDRHSFRINVQSNGSCTIWVDSNRRQPITYQGTIRF